MCAAISKAFSAHCLAEVISCDLDAGGVFGGAKASANDAPREPAEDEPPDCCDSEADRLFIRIIVWQSGGEGDIDRAVRYSGEAR